MFRLILVTLLSSVFAFSAIAQKKTNVRLDWKAKKTFRKSIEDSFKVGWKERDKDQHKVMSNTMYPAIMDIIHNLYTDGYIKAEKVNVYVEWYKAKEKDQPDSENWLNKGKWENLYTDFYDQMIKDMDRNPTQCALQKEVATVSQCCSPLTKKSFVGYKKAEGDSCTETGNECTNHSDCCSKQCMKTDFTNKDEKGSCAPVFSCYRLVPINQPCDPIEAPYCVTPLSVFNRQFPVVCGRVNHESSGIGECDKAGKACSSDASCCSNKCGSDGKCVESYMCQACLKLGESRNGLPEDAPIKCCPGLYESMTDDKKCIPTFPPLVLPTQSSISQPKWYQNIVKKVVTGVLSIIIPSAHAGSGQCNFYTSEQQEKITEAIDRCIAENPSDGEKRQKCINENVQSVKNAYREENYKNAQEEVQKKIGECNNKYAGQPEKYQDCMDEANAAMDSRCPEQMSMDDYVGAYNIPAIRSKTFSEPDKCLFNSFNDNWRDASNYERNAELVIRGFEYTFSGQGTQDFWVEEGEKQNIYQRSKYVADELRSKRVELINEMRRMDILLTCKCVLAKQGQGIDPNVMTLFNIAPECEAEKEALAAISTQENGTDSGEKNECKKITKEDGTEGLDCKSGDSSLGASGLTHEAYLVEFNALRMNAQMKRFEHYATLEEKLDKLSKYIDSANWYDAEEYVQELYEFEVKYMSEWLAIVLVIVTGGLALFIPSVRETFVITLVNDFNNASTFGKILMTIFTGGVALSVTLTANEAVKNHSKNSIMMALYEPAVKPQFRTTITEAENKDEAYNEKTGEFKWDEGKCTNWLCTHRRMKILRSYVSPHFNNKQNGDLKCDIHAGANLCMRSVYLAQHDGDFRYMVDAKYPLFLEPNVFKTDTRFIQSMNDAYNYLIGHLKRTYPGPRTKRAFLGRDIMNEPATQNAMVLMNGQHYAEPFTPEMFEKVFLAAMKYAKCKEITGPNATDECRVDMEGTNLQEGDMGFGYFFETDEDIANFAAYFIQHHYHWPSITASQTMGYPLLAQSAYYQSILHNLRIIGSNAAQRGLEYGDSYDLYKADWDSRSNDYDCSSKNTTQAVCALLKAGNKSKNTKYSQKFRAAFRKLVFKMGGTGGNVSNSTGDTLNGSETGSFSKGESDLYALGQQQALRTQESIQKKAHFDKVVGNTERGKIILDRANEWNRAFNAPLEKMKMSRGGKDWGGSNSGNKGGSSSGDNLSKTMNTTPTTASYKAPKTKPMQNYGAGYSTSSDSSSSYGNYADTGANAGAGANSSVDSSYLLESAEKNKSMFERDDADSLFKIVSKAYFRNLSLILVRQGDKLEGEEVKTKDLEYKPKGSTLDTPKKEELKKLLGD